MHNKKIIAKGLVFTTAVVNVPIDSLANTIEEIKTINTEDNIKESDAKNSIKKFFAKIVEPIEELLTEPKEVIKINKNIVRGSVLQINLGDNDFVQDLSGNPGGYETVKVITSGSKKLVKADYDNLRLSGIPKVDLSNANSDSIPEGAFYNATHLTEFKFPSRVSVLKNSNDRTSNKDVSLAEDLIIPEGTIEILDSAFYGCSNLTGNLIIPDSVTSIGNNAFEGCSGLNGILKIGNSVESIGASAFSDCSGLIGDIIIPSSVTYISSGAFYGCSGFNGKLTIPNSVTRIYSSTFYGCSGLRGELTIPDSITEIGSSAFNGCSGFTGKLIIPDSVNTIESSAFYGCNGFTGELVIPDSIKVISDNVFRNCTGFTGDLIIPNTVTSIGIGSFYGCSGFNGNLVIGNSVTTISVASFQNCTGLTGDLIIPNRVISIGSSVFNGCNGIEKIIVKIDEGDLDTNYRKSIIEKLPVDKTYIEMSYNFDISNTWIETTNYIKSKPTISTYAGDFKNNEGVGIALYIIEASDIKTMTILKDGENYTLEKFENGKYLFNEIGDYQIYIETELGTISNISFKNVSPIAQPSVEYKGGNINIIDNGCLSSAVSEEFDDPNNLVFDFSNSNWVIENGVLKSEKINNGSSTENELKINAEVGDKLQISIKTSSETSYDWGYIYLNGVQVYKKSGTSTRFEVLEFDLQEGENVIKFKYTKDSSGYNGDDTIFIDCIKILKSETIKVDCDTLEYRVNGGEWQIYTDAFELNYPVGTKLKIEVRAKHDGFTSTILSQEVTVEMNTQEIKEAVEKAEQSKDIQDISDARDLVNSMPESPEKDEFQDRLDVISPNLTFDRETGSANLDIYIKSENMLSLSLDTNSITFEEYSGAESMEKLNAVNLTISSSLPYNLNAYMPTEITSSDGNNKMDMDILNIRESNEGVYRQFEDTTNKVVLKEGCVKGNNINHSIDLKLDSNDAHVANIYKTVIKFEAEQK